MELKKIPDRVEGRSEKEDLNLKEAIDQALNLYPGSVALSDVVVYRKGERIIVEGFPLYYDEGAGIPKKVVNRKDANRFENTSIQLGVELFTDNGIYFSIISDSTVEVVRIPDDVLNKMQRNWQKIEKVNIPAEVEHRGLVYIESVLKGYHLSPVPQNQELRDRLADKNLDELTVMLKELKAKTGSNMHNRTDVDTAQRAIRAIEIETYNLEHPMPERELPAVDSLIIGVSIDRDARREKITRRLKQRLQEGMVDEIKGLLDRGIPAENLIYYGLEYKFITEYVIGKTTYDEMFRGLEIAIHQFAKRQMTWFRGMERRGFTIHWIDALQPMDQKVDQVLEIVKSSK